MQKQRKKNNPFVIVMEYAVCDELFDQIIWNKILLHKGGDWYKEEEIKTSKQSSQSQVKM